jgi:hypothetical protein
MRGAGWPARYEIRVDCVLDDRWSAWFEGLRMENEGGATVLSGTLPDQSALHGVLDKIRNLGLCLVLLRRVLSEEPAEDRRAAPASCQDPTPVVGRFGLAVGNAARVWHLERVARLPDEIAVQRWAGAGLGARRAAGQPLLHRGAFPVTAAVLAWLFLRHRAVYTRI